MPIRPPRLLHITPHLGGGIGRALVALAKGDALVPGGQPVRSVLCLEPLEKPAAARALRALGIAVHTLRDMTELAPIVAAYDLVQFEYFSHPLSFAALAQLHDTPVRLVTWCHVSGLHFPRLPAALWAQPMPVALSALCSLQSDDPALRLALQRGQVHVISSAAGFEHWPAVTRGPAPQHGACRFGYLGTLAAAKLHPDYVEWLIATGLSGLRVEMAGDPAGSSALAERCHAAGRPGLLRLLGYCDDVPAILAGWDALVYLLNPFHYGTAEIALLEAMASGVVPIVGRHACELDVVRDGWNGWVVGNAGELAKALSRCREEPVERLQLGARASAWVRETYTTARLAKGFSALYHQALAQPKVRVDWPALIGREPWEWFRSTLPAPAAFTSGEAPQLPAGAAGQIHLERTKGSVHHFSRCFPNDTQLRDWSRALTAAPLVRSALAA